MHFITGGAFNGKRAWVKKTYLADKGASWISAYENSPLPLDINDMDNLLVLEGIEIWLKFLIYQYDMKQTRKIWTQYLNNWLVWEKNKHNRKLVLIGTDLSKGIVPLERENRIWRDLTGWIYQDITVKAEKVEIVWYGINQTIK